MIFYKEDDKVAIREWLRSLPEKVGRKCLLYLDMLEQHGHELRRPIADLLRDGIYELLEFPGRTLSNPLLLRRSQRSCRFSRHREGI